jgi:putative membrane-bound dehydrogenase-like protein
MGASITAQEATNDEAKRSAANAVASLDMYPGTEAVLFASEPLMASPTNLDVDHRGRVWVCEVLNYRGHADDDLRPEGDRILILEDEDGDGVADSSKVFYQGRDIDSAMGICVLGNKVIVTCAPNVIVFTDEDGDDVPDKKEYLFTESGGPQNDHSTHSISFGPDGKLYWNMGNGGGSIHDKVGNPVEDREGRVVVDGDDSTYDQGGLGPLWGGMVFRFNPDGSDFEVLAHNFRNNYEVAVDSLGGVWQSDNDDDGNYAVRLNYILEFGNYGYRQELTGNYWAAPRTGQHAETPQRHWHQNDPGVVPNLVHTGAGSPTGITVYEGRLLPEAFWDRVLHCEAGPGVVWSPMAEKVGAGYTGQMVNLFKGERDRWVRPVDAAVAPDGAVFVSDWYDPVVGWNRQADSFKGRVFRIAPPNHKSAAPAYDVSTAKAAADALTSPNADIRYRAWNALHAMGADAEEALLELYGSENVRHRARALWLLTKIEGRGKAHIRTAVKDADEDIRIVALRAARQLGKSVASYVIQLVHDPSPQVRRECAIALRSNPSSQGAMLWAELAKQHEGNDRWYLEALGIAAEGRWDSFLAAWLEEIGGNWNTPGGRDIIWRSRGEMTPMYLANILVSPDVDAEESKRFLRAFDFQPESSAKRKVLTALVLEAPGVGEAKHTFVATEALLRLDDFDIREDDETFAKVSTLVGNAAGSPQFARLVERYGLTEHYPSLMAVALANTDNPAGITAIRILLDTGNDDAIAEVVGGDDVQAAVAAVTVLGNSHEERGEELIYDILLTEDLPWRVREQAVRSMARINANVLLRLARDGDFPEELKAAAGAAMTRSMNVAQVDAAREYFPMPPLREEALPQMTELLVYIGNVAKGKEMFTKATCVECHIVNGEGTNYGPDLSLIGAKLSKRGLYESILDPNATVSPTYQTYVYRLDDGQEVTGFVESETASHIRLRMAGGVTTEFETGGVTGREAQALSAMPADLQQVLTVDELIDLVEYLASLK